LFWRPCDSPSSSNFYLITILTCLSTILTIFPNMLLFIKIFHSYICLTFLILFKFNKNFFLLFMLTNFTQNFRLFQQFLYFLFKLTILLICFHKILKQFIIKFFLIILAVLHAFIKLFYLIIQLLYFLLQFNIIYFMILNHSLLLFHHRPLLLSS
jgi:hypothetical protein